MDISLARKLYNSGDKDFKALALENYKEKDLNIPSFEDLKSNFQALNDKFHVEAHNDIKATILLSYIHTHIYDSSHDSRDDVYYICYNDYCSDNSLYNYAIVTSYTKRIGCIGFSTMNDAKYALLLFRLYYNEININE